jgi:small subunit ribosomal protein S16
LETQTVVKLRLRRFGRINSPFYRLAVMDSRRACNGLPIEELGHYDPAESDAAKAVVLKTDRITYWLSTGAQPTPSVRTLLTKAGITCQPNARMRKLKRDLAKPAKA